MADKGKVLEVKIKLDNINVPDKINFHKQTNEIMYNDLLQFTLNTKKLETKVIQLDGQLKQEKAANRGWQSKIKKSEVDLVYVGANPKDFQSVKKLLDDKEKVIQTLKRKLKIPSSEHVSIDELVALQQEKDVFHQGVLNLKEKILQLEEEKKILQRDKQELLLGNITISPG